MGMKLKLVKHYMNRYAKEHYSAMHWYSEHTKNINTIFDVGANVGLFTLYASRFYPSAMIHSFEPVAGNFSVLVDNINRNKVEKRVFCYNLGFWSERKVMTLGIPGNKRAGNTGRYAFYGRKLAVESQMEVMDEWASEHSIYPDFIKIDTEGAEVEILKMSGECLNRCKYLVVEIHTHGGYVDKEKLIKSLVEQFNFSKPIEQQNNNFFFKKSNEGAIT